jgi:hypothetical protein
LQPHLLALDQFGYRGLAYATERRVELLLGGDGLTDEVHDVNPCEIPSCLKLFEDPGCVRGAWLDEFDPSEEIT